MEEIALLILTILFELPLVLWFLRHEPWGRLVWVLVSVDMVSHPLAWQAVVHGVSWVWVELAVIAFEALVFVAIFARSKPRAIAAAVLANIFSAGLAVLLF